MTKKKIISVATVLAVFVTVCAGAFVGFGIYREKNKSISKVTSQVSPDLEISPVLFFSDAGGTFGKGAAYRLEGEDYTELGKYAGAEVSGAYPAGALEKFGGERAARKKFGNVIYYSGATMDRVMPELVDGRPGGGHYVEEKEEVFVFDRLSSEDGANEFVIAIGDRTETVAREEGEEFYAFLRNDGIHLLTSLSGETENARVKVYGMSSDLTQMSTYEYTRPGKLVEACPPASTRSFIAELVNVAGERLLHICRVTEGEVWLVPVERDVFSIVGTGNRLLLFSREAGGIVLDQIYLSGEYIEEHRFEVPVEFDSAVFKCEFAQFDNMLCYAFSTADATYCFVQDMWTGEVAGAWEARHSEDGAAPEFVSFVWQFDGEYYGIAPGIFSSGQPAKVTAYAP